MSLKQKIREINWRRKYLTRKVKMQTKFAFLAFVTYFLPKRGKLYDLSTIKKVLIVRNDRIGDMIATTAMIRNLANSGYDVYISSRDNSLEIVQNNPYIKESFIYDDSSLIALYKSIKKIRKYKFDLAVECRFNNLLDFNNIIYSSLVNTPILVGFNKSNIKSYNLSIPYLHADKHVTRQLATFLNLLGIQEDDMHYDLPNDKETEEYVNSFFSQIHQNAKCVVLNPFGSQENRYMSLSQIRLICDFFHNLGYTVILIGEPKKIDAINIDHIIKFNSRGILDIIPLIKHSDIIISVDTSVVHIASAFKKKTMAFYIDTRLKKPLFTQLKDQFNYELLLLEFKLINKLYEKKLNSIENIVPINSDAWSPNNINAAQTVFNSNEIKDISNDELTKTLLSSYDKLSKNITTNSK